MGKNKIETPGREGEEGETAGWGATNSGISSSSRLTHSSGNGGEVKAANSSRVLEQSISLTATSKRQFPDPQHRRGPVLGTVAGSQESSGDVDVCDGSNARRV